MTRHTSIRTLLLAISCAVAATAVSTGQSAAALMSPTDQSDAIERIASLLEQEYVFEDVGAAAAASLRRQIADGAFALATTREAFATTMSERLGTLTGDKHVRMRYRADGTSAVVDPPAAEDGFGIKRTEMLAGGVGYLKVDRFYQREESRVAFDAALTFLADSRAIIVDVRDNRGGSDANVLLASYFVREPVLFTRLTWRHADPMEVFTEKTSPSLPDVPVYVLTSSRTFSAGEGFVYGLQQRRRIVVVGERTAGAGNPNRFFPVAPGLALSVAVGQTINPISGGSWEHVGVVPDVAVAEAEALATALRLIGERLGPSN
jgi:hypothetical protein